MDKEFPQGNDKAPMSVQTKLQSPMQNPARARCRGHGDRQTMMDSGLITSPLMRHSKMYTLPHQHKRMIGKKPTQTAIHYTVCTFSLKGFKTHLNPFLRVDFEKKTKNFLNCS